MSLIIQNKTTLNDFAIITIFNKPGKKTITTNGDFTIIKIDNEIASINVENASKYFEYHEGAHTLTLEEIKILAKENINVSFHSSFKVGEIISRENHPKSEKLFVLKVLTDKEVTIVTNSLNSLVGKQVVVAQLNSILPSGTPILLSKVMGVESEGMLCGDETLGFTPSDGVKIISGQNGEEFIL